MLIIGTIIGAGFASGREIVAFFGPTPSWLVAVIGAVLVFVMCYVFLSVGAKSQADNLAEVNRKIAGKADVLLNICLLFNSAISLSAMLAGFDSLFGSMWGGKPVYSVLFAAVSVFVVMRGLKGLVKCNVILVPLLIVFIVAVCAISFNSPVYGTFGAKSAYRCVTYIGMNMMLAAALLTTIGDLSKKQIAAASVVTAAIVGVLLYLIVSALCSSGAGQTDMPLVTLSRTGGLVMFGFGIVTVAAGIFTTMLTAHIALTDWLASLTKSRLFSAVVTACACLALSFIGFKNVVDTLYPVLGILGALYFVLNLVYLLRPITLDKPLGKAHGKVHKRSKKAENNG